MNRKRKFLIVSFLPAFRRWGVGVWAEGVRGGMGFGLRGNSVPFSFSVGLFRCCIGRFYFSDGPMDCRRVFFEGNFSFDFSSEWDSFDWHCFGGSCLVLISSPPSVLLRMNLAFRKIERVVHL